MKQEEGKWVRVVSEIGFFVKLSVFLLICWNLPGTSNVVPADDNVAMD